MSSLSSSFSPRCFQRRASARHWVSETSSIHEENFTIKGFMRGEISDEHIQLKRKKWRQVRLHLDIVAYEHDLLDIDTNSEKSHVKGLNKTRREVLLRSTGVSLLGAIFHFSGERPKYLGVQKNPPSLALCPPTPACISTSEELNDPGHYVPPWTYNPEDGRGKNNPASKDQAMHELIDAIRITNSENFTPRIVKKAGDYVYVEYESPIFGFVDDVEFWFPPGKQSLVEYRSASRFGQFDFDKNRKRIKVKQK